MTIETLQSEMITAMKNKNMSRKTAISGYIAAIKKAAIDKGCRDNIDEKFVNTELIKIQKSVKEQVDTCPETRPDLLEMEPHGILQKGHPALQPFLGNSVDHRLVRHLVQHRHGLCVQVHQLLEAHRGAAFVVQTHIPDSPLSICHRAACCTGISSRWGRCR